MGLKADVLEALSVPTDPGTGVNLFDLGIIDEVRVRKARVDVSIVPPCNCPFMGLMMERLYDSAAKVKGVEYVSIQVHWDKRWTPTRISDKGRKALGLNAIKVSSCNSANSGCGQP